MWYDEGKATVKDAETRAKPKVAFCLKDGSRAESTAMATGTAARTSKQAKNAGSISWIGSADLVCCLAVAATRGLVPLKLDVRCGYSGGASDSRGERGGSWS